HHRHKSNAPFNILIGPRTFRPTDTVHEEENVIETGKETAVTAPQRDPSLAIQMQTQVWAQISALLHSQVTSHLKKENENGVEQKTVATTTIIITTTARWIRSGTVMSATTTAILMTDLIATGPARRVRGEGID
ncbi:hypothetical protein M9458_023366, partial [Cirrhinus mrigala]